MQSPHQSPAFQITQTRREWCARALAAAASAGFLQKAMAAEISLPDPKVVLADLLTWAARVVKQEMNFDHPRDEQASAFKALGAEAAKVMKVAGNKEGHLLLVDNSKGTLEMRTVSPTNEDRGVNLHLSIHPFADKQRKWMYPPSAGGEMPTHPMALVMVSTEDSEGDGECRSFQLYQYGRVGKRVVFSAAKGLGDFMNEVPEAERCLAKGEGSVKAEEKMNSARKRAMEAIGQEWSADSDFKSLRTLLLTPEQAEAQWSARPTSDGKGIFIQPFWMNDGGSDIAASWASPTGTAAPELLRPFFELVRSLKYEWDASAGQFVLKGTAPRPDDVEFLEIETGEKA